MTALPRAKMDTASLGRAIRYLGHYRSLTLSASLFLLISSAAMLVVPQLLQNIIDSITNGATAQQVATIPSAFQGQALKLLGWTAEQLTRYQAGAESALIWAALLIVAFAVARGFFAFAQGYTSEKLSQSMAFDFRNDLYNKIQKLSFSYHDRNQTGQLMIRATDDVEKVRMFVGQGLLMTLQSLIIFVVTLVILFLTNVKLTLVILPILPVAMILFTAFGRISQPLFMEAQIRLSRLNTILQESLAGIKVVMQQQL